MALISTSEQEESVLERQTQTAAFWRDQFEVTPKDLDFIYGLLLDAQAPKTVAELALALIEEYIRREDARISSELAKGAVYTPKAQYEIGQTLVFPALDFAAGEVIGVRPGQNPEHGEFQVIQVSFADANGAPREFAAELATPHRLSETDSASLLNNSALLSSQEIYTLYRDEIDESMLYALEEGSRSDDFIEVDGKWLLADMLAEIHVGHLNIAEAMIEMQAEPLSTDRLLSEVELDANVAPPMQRISLDHGLASDKRFDNVEVNGEPRWFLKRMEPPEVVSIPQALRPSIPQYNRSILSVELLQIEWEIDDEWGESTLSSELPSVVPNTTFTLTYPHRRMGTLPLNGRTRSFFPAESGAKSMVTFVDGRWGNHHVGWIVPQGRYVAGLSEWMQEHAIPVGAYITLERTNTAGEVLVDFRTRRPKREWARIATPDWRNGQLNFEMNKVQIACEYDETMIVASDDVEGVDALRDLLLNNGVELQAIVEQIVPELTKLNPNGTVHAKSVYSAVNIVRRCPPGPIFHALLSNPKFRDAGSGLFSLS
jgi:hypothetical protein